MVTGANRGIGFGVARGLARLGQRVILACRDPDRAAEAGKAIAADTKVSLAAGRLEVGGSLDLGSLDSVRAFARELEQRGEVVDVLVNNAGVFCPEREETSDGFERCLGVNFLGPFLLTRLLLPRMTEGGGIINISSIAGLYGRLDLGDMAMKRAYGPFRAYARSKLAIILTSLELAERLKGKISVNSLHPGVVNTRILQMNRWYDTLTDLLFRPFTLGIDAGAAPIVELALRMHHESPSGEYFSRSRRMELNPRILDPRARRELWVLASALVGLDPEDQEGYNLPSTRRER